MGEIMSDYETLVIDRVGTDGRVGRIGLNRPEKLNALSQELLYELNDALHAMEADDSIRSIIVRGEGRAFSAGSSRGWERAAVAAGADPGAARMAAKRTTAFYTGEAAESA